MADWFRHSTWESHDREDFARRLARAPAANRAQYLRIQGVHLAEAGLHEPAIGILRRVVDEYPQSLDVAPALSELSRCLLATGAVTESLDVLRRCIRREQEFPNVRTDAWLDFAFTVARLRVSQFYTEAAASLDQGALREGRTPLFPVQRFKLHAARAMLMVACGEPGADAEAKRALDAAALETSGLGYHSGLGLVDDRYADVQERLRGIVGS